MKLQSIEWLRDKLKDVTDFQCSCGANFDDFDLWWNHMWIEKHVTITPEYIEKVMEYLKA